MSFKPFAWRAFAPMRTHSSSRARVRWRASTAFDSRAIRSGQHVMLLGVVIVALPSLRTSELLVSIDEKQRRALHVRVVEAIERLWRDARVEGLLGADLARVAQPVECRAKLHDSLVAGLAQP